MDMMQRRRELLSQKSSRPVDYLANAVWVQNKYINADGSITDMANRCYTRDSIAVTPGASYTLTGYGGAGYTRVIGYDSSDNYVRQVASWSWGLAEAGTKTFTPQSNVYRIRITCYINHQLVMYDAQ